MFEKEIEFIYNYNLNKIKHLGSFITYEQLISTDIHPALLQYVSAEIDFLIYEDRQKLLKDSLFDYSGDKIIEHFANIGEEIKRSKKFSLEYLTKLLLHASSFNVNYIIRPKWSLLQFVFESENDTSKQVVEVKQILNYLFYYPYLKRLLISFFNKKRIITITLSELEELLNKIDKINFESNFDRVLDSALKNMVEFINMGESRNFKISKQSIELFLDDKGLSQYKMILTERFGLNGSDKYEIHDYQNVILDFNTEEEAPIVSEDEIVNEKLESLQKEVSDYKEELNEEDVESKVEDDDEVEKEIAIAEEEVEREKVDLIENIESEKKSFLESHIDGLDEVHLGDSDDVLEDMKIDQKETLENDIEEIEPPDFDEAPRIDDENIDEAYEFVSEEEELDAILDEDTELERVEINDEEGDPFGANISVNSSKLDEREESVEVMPEIEKDGFIELGNSVTFSSDDLTKEENISVDKKSETENDEWHTESSSETEEDTTELDELLDDSISSIIDEIDEEISYEESIDSLDAEPEDDRETNSQQVLFNDKDFEDDEEVRENLVEAKEESITSETEVMGTSSIDISILLENKKITKIIEVVFDYDMEEFANAIDKISECKNEVEALTTIDEIAKSLFIDQSIKEIKVLKNIITDFFK